ncbi:MAG: hypothetical protein QNJ97_21100 [Myxococcota bacterium]|nr:hypothetical protein [Myxococcota bacterium]
MKHGKLRRETLASLLRCFPLLIVMGLALTWAVTCTPDIDQDPMPQFATMAFDQESGRIPMPTSLLINPQTGRIDFGTFGIDVPLDCLNLPPDGMPAAECEFFQYLESLDGWPTVIPASAPSSDPIDMATVTLSPPNATLIAAGSQGQPLMPDTVEVRFDPAANELVVEARNGWDIGTDYVFAVQGYDNGIQAQGGLRMISSIIFSLLKKDESLTCDAASVEALDDTCHYFELAAGMYPDTPELAKEYLFLLEKIRQGYADSGLWDLVDLFGWTKEAVAVIWSFRTHSNPVVELNPDLGMVPIVEQENNIIALPVKGAIDPTTLTAHGLLNPSGSVLLLNLTELEAGNFLGGLPLFTPSVDSSRIVLTATLPLDEGDLYGVVLRNSIADTSGRPLVPSPLSALLRSRGPLVDAQGHTLVPLISDAEAQEAESARLTLAELLDNPDLGSMTNDMQREDIAFVYAFVYPNPTQKK